MAGASIAVAAEPSRRRPPPERDDDKPRFTGGLKPRKDGIVTDPEVLHTPSVLWDNGFGPELKRLTDQMFAAMYATGQGVGLAAVQIGIHFRVCVVDIYALNPPRRTPRVFVNPTIELVGKRFPMREGCLSAPGKFGDVERAAMIRAAWQDETGETHAEELGGMLAHVLQHEVDHMEGVLCTSKMVR